MAERAPQPGGLHQQLEPLPAGEVLVLGRGDVPHGRVRDAGVDVEGGRAGGPVAGALLAVDRPPREGGALETELARALARDIQRAPAPAQGGQARVRVQVREHRQHVDLAVPEGVAVVAAAGQALGGDRVAVAAGRGLEHVEEGEADRLLQLGVAVDLDVGAGPEVVERVALRLGEPIEAGVSGLGQGRLDLVPHRRHRALRGVTVGEHLVDDQRLARLEVADHRQPREVLLAKDLQAVVIDPADLVVHRGRNAQVGARRAVHERRVRPLTARGLGDHRRPDRGGDPRVLLVRLRQRLVRDELGLDDDAQEAAVVRRLDLVADRRDRALHERDQARALDPDDPARGRAPDEACGAVRRRESRARARVRAALRSGGRAARPRPGGGSACRSSR